MTPIIPRPCGVLCRLVVSLDRDAFSLIKRERFFDLVIRQQRMLKNDDDLSVRSTRLAGICHKTSKKPGLLPGWLK